MAFTAYGASTIFWMRFIVSLGGIGADAIGGMFSPASGASSAVSHGKNVATRAKNSIQKIKK